MTHSQAIHNNQWNGLWWNNHTSALQQRPLYTRYQPSHCYQAERNKEPIPVDCNPYIELDRYSDYTFQWSNHTRLQVSNLVQSNQTTICLVGNSHSRGLYEAGQTLDLNHTANILIEHVPLSYPTEVTPRKIVRRSRFFTRPCDKLIIAVGQWPASFKGEAPTLVHDYYAQMRDMILRLRENPRTAVMDVYLRNIHYHSLGGMQASCPPTDWRSPIVMDAYNVVIERVCQEMNVPFLDTRMISGPIWDANPDWNHLAPKTNELELLLLVAAAMGVTPPNHSPAVTHT